MYSFTNGYSLYEQLVMKAPRNLKEDVSYKFPCPILGQNTKRDKFESMYDKKPQIAISGIKHTKLTDKKTIIYRKRASKPINPIFQNPLSKKGENPRGIDGSFTHMESKEDTAMLNIL